MSEQGIESAGIGCRVSSCRYSGKQITRTNTFRTIVSEDITSLRYRLPSEKGHTKIFCFRRFVNKLFDLCLDVERNLWLEIPTGQFSADTLDDLKGFVIFHFGSFRI